MIKPPTPTPSDKTDKNKVRMDLVPWACVSEVAAVMTHGLSKYPEGGWKHVERSRERYFAAAQRHLIAWWEGESKDPDSGLSHLAHVSCCIFFLLWFDLQESK